MKYECHITIDPVQGEELVRFERLCSKYSFKVAKLLKENGKGNDRDQFATGHDIKYDGMLLRMINLCKEVSDSGFRLRRYKTEEILLDSKRGDNLRLL